MHSGNILAAVAQNRDQELEIWHRPEEPNLFQGKKQPAPNGLWARDPRQAEYDVQTVKPLDISN